MKKLLSLVLALSLLVGSSPAVLAKSADKSAANQPKDSNYTYNYNLPNNVVTEQDNLLKGKNHGLLNAVRNHLKYKKNGQPLSESQSFQRLLELLEDRGVAQDILQNFKDSLEELEAAIAELEKAIAENYEDKDNYKALAKMKALKGKKYETYINGKKINYADAEPILENDRTLVPFRIIAEALGAQVSWNAEKQEITLTKNNNTVVLTIGRNTALVNGKTVTLDTPAKIHKNRTMIPLRFLAESLGTEVEYYPEGCLIVIKNK